MIDEVPEQKLCQIIISDSQVDEITMKFILINKLSDDSVILRAKQLDYHYDIYQDFLRDNNYDEEEFLVLGGGHMHISNSSQCITLFGKSIAYGKCDFSKAKSIINKKMPDFTITMQ